MAATTFAWNKRVLEHLLQTPYLDATKTFNKNNIKPSLEIKKNKWCQKYLMTKLSRTKWLEKHDDRSNHTNFTRYEPSNSMKVP